MYVDLRDNFIINDGVPIIAPDGTQYPGNWPKDALPFLAKITETQQPAVPDGEISTGWIVSTDGGYMQVWGTRPMTADELATVTARVRANFVALAHESLTRTDVTCVRCVSANVAVPAEWQTYRNALRAIVNGTDATSNTLPATPAYPAET